jgi:hypothetical protein
VPGTKASRHLQFTVPAAEGSGDADRVVSLFVSSGENTLGLEEGVTYRVDTEACGLPGSRIYMWTAAGLTYCLVTDGEGAGQACDRLIEVLAMPLPTASL